jgi:hypothetical protein
LFISAFFEPSLRLLHAFQALIYLAVIVLTSRNSPWGFGAGCIISTFWNYIFLRGAAAEVWAFLSGHAIRLDIGFQLAATIAHFLLIIACLAGFLRMKPNSKHWAIFLTGGSLAVSYLVLLMMTMRPQYVPLLKKCFGI